jgi:hypothetical protein
VLQRLEDYLREQKGLALPKSQFGKAINYALNQWGALVLYASNGRLEIDNNSSERTLRPCAIGRNYAQFPIMRSGISSRLRLCCWIDHRLRIIRHALPECQRTRFVNKSRPCRCALDRGPRIFPDYWL